VAELFGNIRVRKDNQRLKDLTQRILALPLDLADIFLEDLTEAMENRLRVLEQEAARRAVCD
jgi:hypothetical protein